MTTRLSPRQQRTLTTNLSDEQILQTAASVLVDLGAPDVQIDRTLGCVQGTTRASGWSWGEHVTIRIDHQRHAGEVVVRTEPWMKATLLDWGEASRTIDAIATAFDRADAQRPASVGGDEPLGPPAVPRGTGGYPDVPPPIPNPPQRPIWETPGGRLEPFPSRGANGRANDRAERRRRRWYVAAGVVAVLCLTGAKVIMQVGGASFEDRVEEMQRVPIPGQRVLHARGPTDFTVYYELRGAAQEDVVAPPLTIDVVRQDGELVPLDQPWMDQTYALPGHSGRSVATFTADEAGEYLLMVRGNAPDRAMLAIGASLFGPLLWAGLLVVVAVVVMVLLVAVGGLRRRTARRRASTPFERPRPYR
jgi:hypothetical protein